MWYTYSLISALFSGLAAVLEKKTLIRESPLIFSMLLAFSNIAVGIPLLFFTDFTTLTTYKISFIFIKSVFGTVSFLLVMKGLKDLQISRSLPLLVLTPGTVAVAGIIITGEYISLYAGAGLVLLLLGTYSLQLKKGTSFLSPVLHCFTHRSYIFIGSAVALFTATTLLDKYLLTKVMIHPFQFISLQHLFTGINFLILFIIFSGDKTAVKKAVKNSGYIILAISLFTFIYRFTHIYAVKLGNPALALALKRTSVFYAALIGGRFFKEGDMVKKSVSILIMLTGATLVILF